MRLDTYLSESGLAKSRSFAKILLEEGYVKVNGKVINKPSYDVSGNDRVFVTGSPYSYVSRGGVKLEGALNSFDCDVSGKVCVDIGASTGGFTDCLLKRGAVKIYAIDSGTEQLDKMLSEDPRVVSIENFNARFLTEETIGEKCDVAVTDVSFISQTLIIPAVAKILIDGGVFISLIKPQFECTKSEIGKGGIVKSKKTMSEAVLKVIRCAESFGLGCQGLIKSPISGGDGNTEFLMLCKYNEECAVFEDHVKEVVGV